MKKLIFYALICLVAIGFAENAFSQKGNGNKTAKSADKVILKAEYVRPFENGKEKRTTITVYKSGRINCADVSTLKGFSYNFPPIKCGKTTTKEIDKFIEIFDTELSTADKETKLKKEKEDYSEYHVITFYRTNGQKQLTTTTDRFSEDKLRPAIDEEIVGIYEELSSSTEDDRFRTLACRKNWAKCGFEHFP